MTERRFTAESESARPAAGLSPLAKRPENVGSSTVPKATPTTPSGRGAERRYRRIAPDELHALVADPRQGKPRREAPLRHAEKEERHLGGAADEYRPADHGDAGPYGKPGEEAERAERGDPDDVEHRRHERALHEPAERVEDAHPERRAAYEHHVGEEDRDEPQRKPRARRQVGAAVSAPSPNSLRAMLGIANASVNALCSTPAPINLAWNISRTSPSTRESAVSPPTVKTCLSTPPFPPLSAPAIAYADLPFSFPAIIGGDWCSGRDSNPQGSLHMHLKHACLPISPPEQGS